MQGGAGKRTGLSARRARRTKSRGPKGLQLDFQLSILWEENTFARRGRFYGVILISYDICPLIIVLWFLLFRTCIIVNFVGGEYFCWKRKIVHKGHSGSIRLFTEWPADKYNIHISQILHTYLTNTAYIPNQDKHTHPHTP